MTDTAHLSRAALDASEDYHKTIRVNASPDAVFDAVTTTSGLASWWMPVTGSGDAGGQLTFAVNAAGAPMAIMRVDEARRSESVQWSVTDCPPLPDWVGTRLSFTITPVDGNQTELHFRHHGLTSELECLDMCTRSWNRYLESLREYLEAGGGTPFGSSADRAWRKEEGL